MHFSTFAAYFSGLSLVAHASAAAIGSRDTPLDARHARHVQVLTTGTGTGPVPTSSATRNSTATSTPSPSALNSTGKPVFFHYMIGTLLDEHCEQDIIDAKALGVDAFALNLNTVGEQYALDASTSLFNWANTYDFKLFFSFDMSWHQDPTVTDDVIRQPSDVVSFLQSYANNDAYYKYNGMPFVSTFEGAAWSDDEWNSQLLEPMSSAGTPIYFVPSFEDLSSINSSYFDTYPSQDGAFNWNSWPFEYEGDIVVPTTDDQTLLDAAHAVGKTTIMGVSPLQFKHMDSNDNWYRRGEENLEFRFGQVLSMQPDFVEFQTWNDAGESHYMGNIWPEPIAGGVINTYTDGYNHTAFQNILVSFIQAYKNGATDTTTMYPTNGAVAQGTFWHHTLLAAASCPNDSIGQPKGIELVEDKVTAGILVTSGTTDLTATITSGGTTLGTQTLVPGFNGFSFSGLTTGTVVVTVTDSSGNTVVSGTGPIDVADSGDLYNFNFQVVGLQ